MMELIKGANLLLRFVLELFALGALGYWGLKTGSGIITKVVLGVGAPLAAAVVWGTFFVSQGTFRVALGRGLGPSGAGIRVGRSGFGGHRPSKLGSGVRGDRRDQRHPDVRLGTMTCCSLGDPFTRVREILFSKVETMREGRSVTILLHDQST